jgi:hypothetical protein
MYPLPDTRHPEYAALPKTEAPIHITMGIMITGLDELTEQQSWTLKQTGNVAVTFVYVVCGPYEHHTSDAPELLVLNCTYGQENMNKGKTMDWFRAALKHFPKSTHYGKMDKDTYIHSNNLVEMFKCIGQPMDMVYGRACWGKPCFFPYMHCGVCGGLYIISRFRLFQTNLTSTCGTEDQLMSTRLFRTRRPAVFYQDNFFISNMNHNTLAVSESIPLGLTTFVVGIHRVKRLQDWISIKHWLHWSRNASTSCCNR